MLQNISAPLIDPEKNRADLAAIDEALDTLRTAVVSASSDGGLELDGLVDAHLRARAAVTKRLMSIASRSLETGPQMLLEDIRRRVLERMHWLYASRTDPAYLTVRAYGGVHPRLLSYLALHLNDDVPASRLRVLTGEQVHTERRVRELRDLGLRISWSGSGDAVVYRLEFLDADFDQAARFALEHNIKKTNGLNATQKMFELLKAELGRPVNTRRLQWMSGNQSQYDRRLRELRERYTITTGGKAGGRADVAPDDYVLESLDAKDPGESFKAETIQQIFKRDTYRCRQCGWGKDDPPRSGRRYIEAHHKMHKANRGKGDSENGVTLCNVCHDGVHAEMRSHQG